MYFDSTYTKQSQIKRCIHTINYTSFVVLLNQSSQNSGRENLSTCKQNVYNSSGTCTLLPFFGSIGIYIMRLDKPLSNANKSPMKETSTKTGIKECMELVADMYIQFAVQLCLTKLIKIFTYLLWFSPLQMVINLIKFGKSWK